jgi:hypothetical protein
MADMLSFVFWIAADLLGASYNEQLQIELNSV